MSPIFYTSLSANFR